MRLPIKQPRAASILNPPDLAGGLNVRDGLSEVLDNQLTDCENVWWKDGILKTRPGIKTDINMIKTTGREEEQMVEIQNFPNVRCTYEGESYFLQVAKVSYFFSNGCSLRCFLIGKEQTIKLDSISFSNENVSYFMFIHKNFLYCFTNNQRIYKFDISNIEALWQDITDSEMYIPEVLIQCQKIDGTDVTKEQVLGSGVMLEGFNILSDYYKMIFNTYNPMIVTKENPAHEMRYHIVENITKKYEGKTVKAIYTKDGQNYEHEVTITGTGTSWVEDEKREDGYIMTVWKNNITFWEDYETDNKTVAMIESGEENDLVITAPYMVDSAEKEKIFGMTQCEWFGGTATGLSGGTRLFLGGNTKQPSLVLWSALNNPLFFPENSYFHVGDTTSKVTAFGKQSDMLVIFKENEIWYTTYQQNTNITAENLINQSVVDYSASSVYFPLVQINSNVGCTYPDTIQLCRNRLVWLSNENKVYSLVNENQYNERSVFCVSEMINRRLKDYSVYDKPTSCDWNGYYCLCFDDEIFLMDYNCYGYTHISGHSKTEDANIRIPWYYWKMPVDSVISVLNGYIILSYYHDSDTYGKCCIVCNTLSEENGPIDNIFIEDADKPSIDETMIKATPIPSMIKTKLFDFALPHMRKNIEQVNLQLGNNGGELIKVFFITDNGTDETEVYLDGTETQNYTAGYIDSRAVFPCIKQVVRFGLKLESQGTLAVDGIVLKYRVTGGAR